MNQCCGNCKLWRGDPPSCRWEEPPIPFWAHIGTGDHGDYTDALDGRRCPTWKRKEA